MKSILTLGILAVTLFLVVSAKATTGKSMCVSAGATSSTSGPVKSIRIGLPRATQNVARGRATKFTSASAKLTTPSSISDFQLGEVYAYPNPAKNGAIPILHIEVGIADSVKIVAYSVSGRQVHEHTLTGMPQIITTNGNSVYAYEYPWAGHIASGVYYYIIEADKSGRKLKRSGKLAVIR